MPGVLAAVSLQTERGVQLRHFGFAGSGVWVVQTVSTLRPRNFGRHCCKAWFADAIAPAAPASCAPKP